jgi:hypothetical protein
MAKLTKSILTGTSQNYDAAFQDIWNNFIYNFGLYFDVTTDFINQVATAVTAAEAGGYVIICTVEAKGSSDNKIDTFDTIVNLEINKTFANSNIALPTITGGNIITMENGTATFEVVLDTDGGDTKIYTVGDKFTISVPSFISGGITIEDEWRNFNYLEILIGENQ